jgi:hypothetical protein
MLNVNFKKSEAFQCFLDFIDKNGILSSDFYYYLNVMDYAQEAINQHKKYR